MDIIVVSLESACANFYDRLKLKILESSSPTKTFKPEYFQDSESVLSFNLFILFTVI